MDKAQTRWQLHLKSRRHWGLGAGMNTQLYESILDVVCSKVDNVQVGPQGGMTKAEATFYVRVPAYMNDVATNILGVQTEGDDHLTVPGECLHVLWQWQGAHGKQRAQFCLGHYSPWD